MSRKKYYYRNKSGELAWHDQPAPEFGKENVTRESRRCGTNAWATGLISDAAGCHPSQVKEYRQDIANHGFTGVDVSPAGDVVFSSRKERSRYLKHRGMIDRDGCYGD